MDEFSPAERQQLLNLQGSEDKLPAILARTVEEFRGACISGGYPLGDEGTLATGLHADCVALTRWRWLTSLPVKTMATDARKAAAEAALKKLERISAREYAVEAPTAGTNALSGASGNTQARFPMRSEVDET